MSKQAELTQQEAKNIFAYAASMAKKEATLRLKNDWNGVDGGACGFAWVEIVSYKGKKIDGRSKMGKLLKSVGIEQNYRKVFYVWNPAEMSVQCVDVHEAGASAFAVVLRDFGFDAHAASRLD